jgi:pimeloyl-ACP methyl ester carboxylesterase
MGGSEDQVTGIESSREIAEKINSEIFVFDGFGHAVYDENEEFKAKAKEFLIKSLL